MKKTLFSMGYVVVLGLGLVLSLASSVAAQDAKQKKKPSDRTVRVIMSWAFAAIPETVKRGGKDVKIDRANPKDFYIPVNDARRVIRVSIRSANADLCGLTKIEGQNFLKLMSSEKALKKWTPNQITFIKHLHIATSLVMTGSFMAGDESDKKDEDANDAMHRYNCDAEERERIRAAVEAYIK